MGADLLHPKGAVSQSVSQSVSGTDGDRKSDTHDEANSRFPKFYERDRKR